MASGTFIIWYQPIASELLAENFFWSSNLPPMITRGVGINPYKLAGYYYLLNKNAIPVLVGRLSFRAQLGGVSCFGKMDTPMLVTRFGLASLS